VSFKENEMDITEKTSVSPTEERLHVDLRRLGWTKGLSDETVTAITNKAEWVHFHAGPAVVEVDSEVTHVYLLIRGRMHVALYDLLGKQIKQGYFCSRVCCWIVFHRFVGSLLLASRGH
jgi:hypothetical protein